MSTAENSMPDAADLGARALDPRVAPAAPVQRSQSTAWRRFSRNPFGRFFMQAAPPLATLVVAIIAWEIWVVARDVPAYIIPRPEAVFWRFIDDRGSLFGAFRATATAAIVGYLIAITVGFSVAIIFASNRIVQRCLFPLAIVLQTMPVVATAPLILIWLGTGRNAIVTIVFMITVFPIIANSTVGLMSAEHNMVNLFRMNNASRVQELWKLRIPYAMPYVLAGLKISAGLSVIGAIVGEFFAGTGGANASLGSLITFSAARLQIDMLFAAALCASALGITFFSLVSMAGNYAVRNWHESALTSEN